MRRAAYSASLLLLLSLSSSQIRAGVRIKMETVKDTGQRTETGWIYVEGEQKLRIDSGTDPEGTNPEESMIFQADSQTLYMLDHGEKEYLLLDAQTMQQLASSLDQAMRQMQAKMAQMPEAQRKVMEDMLGTNSSESGDLTVDVRDVGRDGDLQKYEVWIGGTKRTEIWVTDASSAKVPPEAISMFKQLSSFYQEMMKPLSEIPFFREIGSNPFPGFAQMNGFPVRVRQIEEKEETHFSEAETITLESDFFSPPPEYKERTAGFQ